MKFTNIAIILSVYVLLMLVVTYTDAQQVNIFQRWKDGTYQRTGTYSSPITATGCERIAYQGVANCMTNFRPTTIGSKGRCCAWRKYRACINGLQSGVRWAAQTDRCPAQSFSKATIDRISDRLVGFPISACDNNPCRKQG